MKKIILKFSLLCFLTFIFSCKNRNKTVENKTEIKSTETKLVTKIQLKGNYCFLKAENKDTTIVRLQIISNDDIKGEMIWKPWQKDGAIGTLTGKLNSDNEMELMYDYIIEGSKQTETKIMKIENEKLLIKKGELIDPKYNGNLIFKNASKATYKEILNKSNCNLK